MKILISWIGFNEDFISSGESVVENTRGFTVSLQRDIIGPMRFDRHIILCTSDKSGMISSELERKKKMLGRLIKDEFPNHVLVFMDTGIDKADLQDFTVIESALRTLLQKFDADDQLHVVAGTGPTAVGMAWCTLYLAMKDRFSLHVLQKAEYVPGSNKSMLKQIEPLVSSLLDDTLRESHLSSVVSDGIFRDETVDEEYHRALVFAQSAEMNVLILGETGCGKDRIAEFIVQQSPIASKTFKPINCASLPDELLYSELFGHKAGAFTGATQDRKGLFEECNGGTLFLDEIGDISPYMQQSLLRTLENKEIKMLGSNEIKKNIKVRIIAATNVDLYQKCKEGRFRWDLYYRLSNPEIIIQPYRSRTEEGRRRVIAHYLSVLEKKWGRALRLTDDAVRTIEKYSFPGNFREIFNTLNSLFPLRVNEVGVKDLPARFLFQENLVDESYESALRNHCMMIYRKYGYNLNATRKALGYGNTTQLKKKFLDWGIFNHNEGNW